MTVYSETGINRSCSKAETLLRTTGTLDPVYFLYASLSRISKAETVKITLLQTDKFFQSSDKKVTCLAFFFFFFHMAVFEGSSAILLSLIPRIKFRFEQFLWTLSGQCMHHRFVKVHLANWKQIIGKKLVESQTWFLKRWDFSCAVHLWKTRGGKSIFP